MFLDANVLFSAAWREDGGLRRLFEGAGRTLMTSRYALLEARRNLPADAIPRLERFMENVALVPDVTGGELPAGVDLPEKDRPILLSALAAGSSHLLTGDAAHFGGLYDASVAGMRIMRPGDYLRRGEVR